MSLRDAWQRISVTSIVPPNQQTVTVSLFISGTSGSDVIASGWVLERGSLPTSLNNRCHDLYADGLLQRRTKKSLPENPHHVISVDDLIGRLTTCGLGRSLGNFRVAEVNEKPLSMDAGGRSPVRLRGVAVHGSSGAITVGSLCLSETLAECSDNGQAGAGSRSPPTDELAVGSVSSAAHFMPLRADCYWDWLISSISRFETYNAESLALVGQAGSYPLLMRPCDTEWKKDLVSLIIPENIKRVILRPGVHLRVEDLLYAPPPPLSALSKGFLLAAERLKARVYTQLGVPQRRPWRKIFLLPSIDCANRIAYLPDLTAELERQGFEVLQVQALSVAQSIYAFSEASHVVAFSTEMLVNAVFCAPQTIIRELSCRCHSVLSLETIASLRDLDYKCLDKAASVRFRKPFEI